MAGDPDRSPKPPTSALRSHLRRQKAPHEPRLHARRSPTHRYGRLIAAAVLAVVTAHPAAAQDSFRIETSAGGCLEIADASTRNDAPLQQYRCLGTDNQLFTTQEAEDGLVRIKTFTGKCLETLDSDPPFDDSIVQGD